jgi:putative peptidoglycan lipid II flippase
MTRWMFPYIGFMSMVALSAGILNTWKHFAVPAATPVLLNVCVISAAWWGAPWLQAQGLQPVYALPAGVMLGGALQLALQIPALKRLGLLPSIGLRWSRIRHAAADPATRQIAKLMGPALLGVGVAQISLLINTQIASHLIPGSVSWLTYADRLMEFPTAMLGVALGVVLMPQLAAARATGDTDRYSAMLDWGLRLVLLFTLPCAVALLLLRRRKRASSTRRSSTSTQAASASSSPPRPRALASSSSCRASASSPAPASRTCPRPSR